MNDSNQEIRTLFMSNNIYQNFVRADIRIGKIEQDGESNVFTVPKEQAEKIIEDSKGNIDFLENALGFPNGHFGKGPIHRVDILYSSKNNLRRATGYEFGVNCFWNTKLNEEDKQKIKFVTKDDGYLIIDNQKYHLSNNSHNIATINFNGLPYEIIDIEQTPHEIIKRIRGRYVTSDGKVHKPDPTGYDCETSGGLNEMVINAVENLGIKVKHFTYWGGHRSGDMIKKGFEKTSNYTATTDCVLEYTDIIRSIDIRTEAGKEKLKNIIDETWKNIIYDREWISNASTEEKKKQGYPTNN